MIEPEGLDVTGGASAEEVAAIIAALTVHRARREPTDNYEKWRRVRQFTVSQAML